MFGIGKKKVSLIESDIFTEFTDWHSHILPGVDDGIKTMDQALAVLEEYERLGFKKVWLTPHIMEDYPNGTDFLKERFEELKSRWKGNVEIALAAENMLDNIFDERLKNNDMLPIGEDHDHLLVETSYYTPPFAMEEMLENARKKGYNIILAHPERYRYMDFKDYERLKEKGIKFQINILSLGGGYGEQAQKKAEWLVNKKYVDFLGSDIHSLEPFLQRIADKNINKNLISLLKN